MSAASEPPSRTSAGLLVSIVFVPFFFFGSVYAQVSLGETAQNAGRYILWFFVGFVVMAQIGGRRPRADARPGQHRRVNRAPASAYSEVTGILRDAPGGGRSGALVHDVQIAFAHSTQTLVHVMAGVLAATFVVAVLWMPRGRVETADADGAAVAGPDVALPRARCHDRKRSGPERSARGAAGRHRRAHGRRRRRVARSRPRRARRGV